MIRHELVLIGSLLACSPAALAETYDVAQRHPHASDANPGTAAAPWKTIARAAKTLGPGDTAAIHAGTYREWVQPARGGTSALR